MDLTVEGRLVTVADSATVLDAVRAAGAEVPTLCHHERLSPTGTCRVCLVLADGHEVAACVTPAVAGMAVDTRDPAVVADVRGIVELTVQRLPGRALDHDTELTRVCESLSRTSSVSNNSG